MKIAIGIMIAVALDVAFTFVLPLVVDGLKVALMVCVLVNLALGAIALASLGMIWAFGS